MNQLQLTLIAIGAGLLVAVWLFNRIQEWRWHRMARSTLGQSRPDVLLGEAPTAAQAGRREEPLFGSGDEVPPSAAQGAGWSGAVLGHDEHEHLPDAAQTDAFAIDDQDRAAGTYPDSHAADGAGASASAVAAAASAAAAAAAVVPREDLLAPPDEEIEYLVPLACNAPVTGVELWRHLAMASPPRRGTRWLGRRVTDGNWCAVLPDSEQRFDSLRAALLLASRAGPVTSLDLEHFCSLVSAVATKQGWRVEFPSRAPALERAEALDTFCADVDVVVGINVVVANGQSVPAARVARWAESHGMVLDGDGGYQLSNAQGYPLWRLVNRDPRPFTDAAIGGMTVTGLTFLLDVPLVESANQRLSPMFDAAATLARELSARVLDDNGAALGPQQLGRIARELGSLLERMEADGIPAGGVRARRLFTA